MIAAALLAIVAGILLVRLGWGGRRYGAAAGWTVAAAALALLTWRDGAWGLALGCVAGMIVALAVILHAGWTSPRKAGRAPRQAPAITLPRRPSAVARRVAVFALTVPVAFAAAQWLAFAAQALARASGSAEADAIVLMLFVQPVAWGLIVSVQMTRADPVRMLAAPFAASVVGGVLWSIA